jgi:alpha-beta hydrolase superfamily lysophospholipase
MILFCPAILLDKKMIPSEMILKVGGYINRWFPEWPFSKRDRQAGFTNVAISYEYMKDHRSYQGNNRLGSGLSSIQATLKLQSNLNRVREPFIVVHGTEDVTCHVDGARMLVDKAQSKIKTFVEIKGANHILIEEPPEVIQGYTKNCLDFLDNVVKQ